MPQGTPVKAFTYSVQSSSSMLAIRPKLKNQKSLNASGEYLAQNQFGYAVVVVSAGLKAIRKKDLVAHRGQGHGGARVPG